jgi:hypothetical protein
MKKYYCKCCGDKFTVSKETKELIEDGFIEEPEYCSDCINEPEYDQSYEQYSDCDSGL